MAANVAPVCVELRQLDMHDTVYQCVSQLSELLEPWQTSSFLRNGKIEMQLKLFIGAAWERGNPRARAFVMDKAFYQPGKESYPSGKDEKQRRKKKGRTRSAGAGRRRAAVLDRDQMQFLRR
jgi:hypothetical protein